MDAIDLTGSGSDDDDPKRSSSSSVGFSAYAAQPSSAGFATASGSGSGSGSGATGAAGRAGAVNPSISTSTSPKAHRPPNSQQQSLPSSSSSHTHHASSSSTSLPASATIHSSTPTTNNVHRTASSASASGSGSNSASASGYPQFSGVAKSTPATTARGDEDDVMVTGQSGPSISPASARPSGSYGAMLGAASAAAHHQSQPSQPFFSPSFYSNGAGPSSSSSSDPPIAGPSNSHTHSRHDDGSTAAAAIDVDSLPPAPPSRRPNPKKPVCIGAFMSRAIMLYPQSCAMAGCGPPAGSKWDLVNFRGVEMIRVKLKVSDTGLQSALNSADCSGSRFAGKSAARSACLAMGSEGGRMRTCGQRTADDGAAFRRSALTQHTPIHTLSNIRTGEQMLTRPTVATSWNNRTTERAVDNCEPGYNSGPYA